MAAEERARRQVESEQGRGGQTARDSAALRAGEGSSAAAGTVPGAVAPAPRPGAAASRPVRVPQRKLEVVVAVALQNGTRVIPGLQPPAALVRARKAIAQGRVTVDGADAVLPGLLVAAGTVRIDGELVDVAWV